MLVVDSAVWVACANGLVDVYNADTHARVATIRARSAAIALLVAGGDFVWLASTDGGVSVYRRDCVLQDTLAAHGAKVTGMAVVEAHVWTCGADLAIRVWQLEAPFACRKELVVQSLMTALIYHLGMVWVGTESAIVRWNTQSYRRLDTLDRNGKPLHCINAMVSVDANGSSSFAVHFVCHLIFVTHSLVIVGRQYCLVNQIFFNVHAHSKKI